MEKKRIKNTSGQIEGEVRRYCGIGRSGLVLQPNGDAITCPALPNHIVGNVNFNTLKEIWLNSVLLNEIREKNLNDFKFCSKCMVKADCGGSCRAKAYHYSGDIWGRDPIACIQYGMTNTNDFITKANR